MSEPHTDSASDRLRALIAERNLVLDTPLSDGFLASAWRPLEDKAEARVAWRADDGHGQLAFRLEIHAFKDDADPDAIAFRVTVSQLADLCATELDGRLDYPGPQPDGLMVGYHGFSEAFERIAACLDWFASLPQAPADAPDRLYRRIKAALVQRSWFCGDGVGVDDPSSSRLSTEVRPGATAALEFFIPDVQESSGGGLVLTIYGNGDEPQGEFMVGVGKYNPRDRRKGLRGLRYNLACVDYDGPRPRIPDRCDDEDAAFRVAKDVIDWLAGYLKLPEP